MFELKKNGKILTSKSVGAGPSSYEKSIYRAAASQRLRNTALGYKQNLRIILLLVHCSNCCTNAPQSQV